MSNFIFKITGSEIKVSNICAEQKDNISILFEISRNEMQDKNNGGQEMNQNNDYSGYTFHQENTLQNWELVGLFWETTFPW